MAGGYERQRDAALVAARGERAGDIDAPPLVCRRPDSEEPVRTVSQALVLLPQVMMADVRNEIGALDVQAFIRQTAGLVPYVPDVPTDEDTQLVRALLEVPLGDGVTLSERFAPYIDAGVSLDWAPIVMPLHIRTGSALVHPQARAGSEFVYSGDDDDELVVADQLGPRDRLLRPRARTLAVTLERTPGDSTLGRAPPYPRARTSESALDGLFEELCARIRATIGGEPFLQPDPVGRALSVLAATVAAVLGDHACQRLAGRKRVVRADVYRGLFDALKLDEFFGVAREVLEVDHPFHRPFWTPWPPGEGVEPRDLGILLNDAGYLALDPAAILPVL